MPLAIQVHHAVCDGLHVAKFIDTLEALFQDVASF
ncbi:chloramphenicol O-acetyltransferase [Sphingobacterium zeae]|uniref:Chloramphenicol O-acetyltransferase n=1 Tax=Sphingobacterium zeae TaxID=1776859 RepID=A0ABU0U5J2_9SPHI|nr:chloramphenicol O-acetyltransferase [Sphingobacterium zeae]